MLWEFHISFSFICKNSNFQAFITNSESFCVGSDHDLRLFVNEDEKEFNFSQEENSNEHSQIY